MFTFYLKIYFLFKKNKPYFKHAFVRHSGELLINRLEFVWKAIKYEIIPTHAIIVIKDSKIKANCNLFIFLKFYFEFKKKSRKKVSPFSIS
jgi:hypothetical protein